ncbi:MAG TPA: enoyl-CoA hydratase/isomerase family protein [Pyrinomonadaceae bacterium]|jgi:enoyl-CoA hydratase|nr:enoyl-CoA hydratase/isomerase family protein [Pyrinomonadaceae bacterium]
MTDELKNEKPAPDVIIETLSRIAVIRLNRPAERNSFSASTLEELDQAVSTLGQRADINALIFTGTKGVFASGANIRELSELAPATARELALRGQRLMQSISDSPKLTIAAVNGFCMGGGLDLALACDLRCASKGAVFAHPGARLGIITGWGGTQRLPRLIGPARALEILLTARRVTSAEALEIGLVSWVGDAVLDHACEMAEQLV